MKLKEFIDSLLLLVEEEKKKGNNLENYTIVHDGFQYDKNTNQYVYVGTSFTVDFDYYHDDAWISFFPLNEDE